MASPQDHSTLEDVLKDDERSLEREGKEGRQDGIRITRGDDVRPAGTLDTLLAGDMLLLRYFDMAPYTILATSVCQQLRFQ